MRKGVKTCNLNNLFIIIIYLHHNKCSRKEEPEGVESPTNLTSPPKKGVHAARVEKCGHRDEGVFGEDEAAPHRLYFNFAVYSTHWV